ncbi:Hormone receptor 4 [Orchesella cincta]|uniref:Hormone receptor 4 n=1 Tax=Orchesella cincta TaxID=48709 RepID=A0A1D2NCJ7_ORCCI|nr:Hormone receptor 4 [Orchesella cincta]
MLFFLYFAAVREDRMPGGRNSGAVYNLYKVPVKYRKHKKGNRGAGKGDKSNSNSSNNSNTSGPNHNHLTNGNGPTSSNNGNPNNNSHPNNLGAHPGLSMNLPSQNGTILKAALTSPNEVHNMRQMLPVEQALNMTNSLVQCDNLHDIAALHNWEELLEARGDLSDKLCKMGDSIVYRLVQWTKRLPFYAELPVDVHTRILTHKWHELLVLTTSAWQAMHTPPPPAGLSYEEETMENLRVLQRCLQAMMGRSLTIDQLRQDVGQMVERLTHLTRTFRRLGIRTEEYVTLKVISMLQNTGTKSNEVGQIQDRYIRVLRTFLEVNSPGQPNRLSDLLRCLPEVQAAASLLLESKMFYVPFLLNSALLQR